MRTKYSHEMCTCVEAVHSELYLENAYTNHNSLLEKILHIYRGGKVVIPPPPGPGQIVPVTSHGIQHILCEHMSYSTSLLIMANGLILCFAFYNHYSHE